MIFLCFIQGEQSYVMHHLLSTIPVVICRGVSTVIKEVMIHQRLTVKHLGLMSTWHVRILPRYSIAKLWIFTLIVPLCPSFRYFLSQSIH